MSDIKINNAQQGRLDVWKGTQNRINSISLKSIYLNYYQLAGSSFVDKVRDVIIITICSVLIIKEQSTLGALLTISYILGQLTYSLSQIYQFSKEFQDAKISLDRLSEIQNKDEENLEGTTDVDKVKQISFNSVSFKYYQSSANFVIDNISLDIPINKTTAIVGRSGSGKTTLVKILLGFYTPQKGMICINGHNMESLLINRWRDKCGSVLQDGFIFSSTVAENIALGSKTIDMEGVKYAARIACADDFIELLPNKYETKIGNAGIQLSGGQKQRLLIARAVYKNPEVLIFDEATSHLDTENEKKIILNLQNCLKNKTIIVIAHRLSTVVNADKIVYLENGKIAEEGTHSSLSRKNGYYYRLIKNQLQNN
jgi:ATP-binding cassette subfamily B protein